MGPKDIRLEDMHWSYVVEDRVQLPALVNKVKIIIIIIIIIIILIIGKAALYEPWPS
jgi:hypothetical protein